MAALSPSSGLPPRSSSTPLFEPSPRPNESHRTIGSDHSPSSNGSWVIADVVAPTRLLEVEDVVHEVFSFLSFHEIVAMRGVSIGVRSLVDDCLNFSVLLSTLKVRRGRTMRGVPREWPEGQSLERCRTEVANELSSYDWTEDGGDLMREERRESTSLMVVVVESQRRGLRGFPKESVAFLPRTEAVAACEIDGNDEACVVRNTSMTSPETSEITTQQEELTSAMDGAGNNANCNEKKNWLSASFSSRMAWAGIRDPPPLLLLSQPDVKLRSLDDVPLEKGTVWASPWEVHVPEDGPSDADGWSYAVAYNGKFTASKKVTSMVRCREHRRRVIMAGSL